MRAAVHRLSGRPAMAMVCGTERFRVCGGMFGRLCRHGGADSGLSGQCCAHGAGNGDLAARVCRGDGAFCKAGAGLFLHGKISVSELQPVCQPVLPGACAFGAVRRQQNPASPHRLGSVCIYHGIRPCGGADRQPVRRGGMAARVGGRAGNRIFGQSAADHAAGSAVCFGACLYSACSALCDP